MRNIAVLPWFQAVCCGDRLHCCPANYQCDEAHKFCVHGDTMLPWVPVNMKTAQVLSITHSVSPSEIIAMTMALRYVDVYFTLSTSFNFDILPGSFWLTLEIGSVSVHMSV